MGCILMVAVIEAFPMRDVADILRYPWILHYIYIIGFCLMGLALYIKMDRHNINPIRFLKHNTRRVFLICLLAITVCIIIMGVLITLVWHYFYYGTFEGDLFSAIDRLLTGGSALGLSMYVAVFIIGLSFYHLLTAVFPHQRIPDIMQYKRRSVLIIAVIIGIAACISRFAYVVMYISMIYYGYEPPPDIELGLDFVIHILYIPYWISYLLLITYLILIFDLIIKSIPFEFRKTVLGTLFKMDISSNFRIASFLVIVFGTARSLTGIIQYRFSAFDAGTFGGPLEGPPMHQVLIHNIHKFLGAYSQLFVLFGFLLFCLGFYHIFRAWELQRLTGPGKPT